MSKSDFVLCVTAAIVIASILLFCLYERYQEGKIKLALKNDEEKTKTRRVIGFGPTPEVG